MVRIPALFFNTLQKHRPWEADFGEAACCTPKRLEWHGHSLNFRGTSKTPRLALTVVPTAVHAKADDFRTIRPGDRK